MDRYIKNPILGPGARIGHNASAPPFVFWDDFVGVSAMAIAANDNTIWDVDVDEGEGTVAALDEHGGWMRIKCASTTNNEYGVEMAAALYTENTDAIDEIKMICFTGSTDIAEFSTFTLYGVTGA